MRLREIVLRQHHAEKLRRIAQVHAASVAR
jgi:hypothetical protein